MKTLIMFLAISILIVISMSHRHIEEYQVFALNFCDEGKVLAKNWVIGANEKDSVHFFGYFWLLRGSNGKNILVDAGWIDSTHRNKSFIRPDSILQQLNISPQEISDIIITHPHYDHIGGIRLFPNAQIWMNQDDYDYYISPEWKKSRNFKKRDVFNIQRIKMIQSQGKLKLVKGDNIEIMPGIKAFTGSKHTYENMYLMINPTSDKKRILLASDAVWFYMNLEKELPITYCSDTAAYVNAIRRMKTMMSNQILIIPGHDKKVLSNFTKVNDRIVQIKE